MLNWLKQHIKNTPLDELRQEWKQVEEQFPTGVNAFDYIENTIKSCHVNYVPPKLHRCEANIYSNLTSNFSGSFFLV